MSEAVEYVSAEDIQRFTTRTEIIGADEPQHGAARYPDVRSPVDADGRRTWWQLSFARDGVWLGSYLTDAPTLGSAITRSHRSGCNPGGEIAGVGFRARSVPDGYADRLITDDDTVWNMPDPDGLAALPEELEA